MFNIFITPILIVAAIAIMVLTLLYVEDWLSSLDDLEDGEEDLDAYWMLKCTEEEYY